MHTSLFLVFFFISGYGAVPLLISVTRKIKLIEDSTSETTLASTAGHAIAVDYHYERGEIYYTEATGQIFRRPLRNDSRGDNTTIIAEVKVSDGIAVDWVHNNIYWTDFIRKTLEVSTLDGLYRHVLFNESHGLEKPRAIVVDPAKGILFWSDWGENPRIESSGLDGKNNKTIVSSSLKWPNGLALDLSKSKLYILDAMLSKIYSCNYDGSNYKTVVSSENLLQSYGLTFYSNTLFWDSWRERALFKMNLNNLQIEPVIRQSGLQGLIERMMGVKAVHASLQPKPSNPDPCKSSGCSHLCFVSRDLTASCFCPFGFKLLPDERTCEEEGYLLLSWRRTIRRYDVNASKDEPLIDTTKAAISLGYHLQKELIFWSDIEEHRIYRAHLNQLNNKTVIATPETCDGLAVDWIHDVIYWTDNDRDTLEAAELDGSKHMIIFDTGLDQPRDIALDPFAGLMFWSDWGDTPKIEQSTLDGLERKVIIDDDHIWPNGLTIDIPSKKIYYVDGKIGSIFSSSYDGTDKKTVFSPPPTTSLHLFGITVLKSDIFWTDWESRTLYKSSKDDIVIARSLARSSTIFLRPNGIKAVHSSLQERKANPCAKVRCQNLCLGTKQQTAHCMGAETLEPDANFDNLEVQKNVSSDFIEISLPNNVAPETVFITIKCLGRLGCEDLRCSNKSAESHVFNNMSHFSINELFPATHYELYGVSARPMKEWRFNFTTEATEPPEIPKITTVDIQGKKVTIKWEPVDTCFPGFTSYHYMLYKTGNENNVEREGRSNLTEVTFDNLEADSYNIHVSTTNPQYFSSKTFELKGDLPAECLKPEFQCDGKEDCPDGTDEVLEKCAAIENVVVYKKSKTEVFFRIVVTNGTRKQLQKFVVNLNSAKSDNAVQFTKIAEQCVIWPESYCLHLSSLRPNTNYTFKISAVLNGEKIGNKFAVTATTKVEASGPPENVQVIKHNATCLMYQWQHPNQSNGIIKSFIINIDETETFEEEKCCQAFPIIELPVSSEEFVYETATTGLTPASSYGISIVAKNMYVGMPVSLTANTPPPPMEIMRMPKVEVSSLLPLSWQPAGEPGESPRYHDLITSYILLLLPPKDEYLNDDSPNNLDGIKELLQSKYGDRFIVIWNKEVSESAAFQSAIKVASLTARKRYKLAWVQVSQYKDSYSIDVLESDPFIAL